MSTQSNFPSTKPSLLLDFANTKQLDPRITFTRASTGTFYDGRTVAKAEENLFPQSQAFDDAVWTKSNLTVTANNQTAPDGTTTAETVTASAFTGSNVRIRRDAAVTDTFTLSAFIKAGTHSIVCLQAGNASAANNWAGAVFDLSAGTVTQTAAGSASTLVASSITAVGNSWFRCVITVTLTTYGTPAHQVLMFNSSTGNSSGSFGFTPTVTFAGTETIQIWGAQLEQRSSVTAYTATTTAPITNYIPALQTAAAGVPRFEHNPTTGESLGLEIEEQRTNLLTYSEQFDNAAWAKTAVSVSANVAIAPDGTLTADKLIADSTTGQHRINLTPTSSAGAQTLSVYAKAGEYGFAYIRIGTTGALFNLSTGAYISSLGSPTSYSSTSVGNGWYRLSVTVTALANDIARINAQVDATTNDFAGNGFSGVYIWGAQLEAGAFATSYIQTVASQVTRSADSASMTGANFSSWYRADEGTVYAEAVPAISGYSPVFQVDNGTADNRILLEGGVDAHGFVRANATTQCSIDMGATAANTNAKFAFAYKVNDFAGSLNAGTVGTDTDGILPVVNTARIAANTSQSYTQTIKKIAFYPLRLTNAQLQALTS